MKRKKSRRLGLESLELRRLLAAVDIPDDLTGAAAAQVAVPVNVDTAAGIRGVEIRLSYDTDLLDLTSDAITAGSVFSGAQDTQVTANVDDAAGTVVIFVSTSTGLSAISGSLVQLSFTIAEDAVAGNTAVFDLTEVVLNEGEIAVDPAPVVGSDSTDGVLTVTAVAAGDQRIAGFVYADTNNNNVPDGVEGIPGVVITLTNVSTGATVQATTDATGKYEFTDLAFGAYTLNEIQPIAYSEGGVNELSVTLVSGQTTADQNFRETGLLPQFIYNRLLTTSTLPAGSTAWTDVIKQINDDATAGSVAPVAASSVAAAAIASASTAAETMAVSTTPTIDTAASVSRSAEAESDGVLASVIEDASSGDMMLPLSSLEDRKDDAVDDDYESVDQVFATNTLW
ncbi:cohesin domain-containing protein [Novipirellula caenicola]|uniref:Serine-aspartate repeat-containing protein D n=1 Tax=Novipirellula caenicola TaxID=1536901 RepID=A0ABP9VVK8_9BACT